MGAPAGYKAESPDSMALALRPTIYNPSTNMEELDFGRRSYFGFRNYNDTTKRGGRGKVSTRGSNYNLNRADLPVRRKWARELQSLRSAGFGKRRKSRKLRKSRKSRKHHKKLPKALLRKCRKLKIKTTVKKGKKRVPKSLTQLKRQIARKMRSLKRK